MIKEGKKEYYTEEMTLHLLPQGELWKAAGVYQVKKRAREGLNESPFSYKKREILWFDGISN